MKSISVKSKVSASKPRGKVLTSMQTASCGQLSAAIRPSSVSCCTMISLLAAGPLMRFVGAKVEAMITRILGVILAALAAQFVLDGLERSLPGLAG